MTRRLARRPVGRGPSFPTRTELTIPFFADLNPFANHP